MHSRFFWLVSSLTLIFGMTPSRGAEPTKEQTAHDGAALASKIDQIIAKRWKESNAQPAAKVGDSEFLRRVYIDLAGRVPTVAEARTFLEDSKTDKRERLVDQLLESPRYITHFTNVWRALLIPEAGNNFQVKLQQGGFEEWLRKQVAKNAGYDQLVRELLTVKVGQEPGGFAFAGLLGNTGPLTYYLAKEYKPENLAAGAARVFMGISVECAQCHNHPFADWKKEQFWGFAAFFSGIESQRLMDFLVPGKEDPVKHEMTIPGGDKKVVARFLDGTEPAWTDKTTARTALADWLTSPANPYFSRAIVNRVWAYFLGYGIVEPLDEMSGASSNASHPELLDLLAKEFAGHQFDLKFLIRAITSTRAYQTTSAKTNKSHDEAALFNRIPLRGLTPEQLFDSVATATGFRDSGGGDDLISGITGGARSARSEFLTKFARSERPVDAETSILQALSLMNGKVTATATSLETSETLSAVLDAPFMKTPQRVETLYLATLSRKPSATELDRANRFIDESVKNSKNTSSAYGDALADLFWALLNSPEFILNH